MFYKEIFRQSWVTLVKYNGSSDWWWLLVAWLTFHNIWFLSFNLPWINLSMFKNGLDRDDYYNYILHTVWWLTDDCDNYWICFLSWSFCTWSVVNYILHDSKFKNLSRSIYFTIETHRMRLKWLDHMGKRSEISKTRWKRMLVDPLASFFSTSMVRRMLEGGKGPCLLISALTKTSSWSPRGRPAPAPSGRAAGAPAPPWLRGSPAPPGRRGSPDWNRSVLTLILWFEKLREKLEKD